MSRTYRKANPHLYCWSNTLLFNHRKDCRDYTLREKRPLRDGTCERYACGCSWCIEGRLHASKRRMPVEDVWEEVVEGILSHEEELQLIVELESLKWHKEELEWEKDNGWE